MRNKSSASLDPKINDKIVAFNDALVARLDNTNFYTEDAANNTFYLQDEYDEEDVDLNTTPTDKEYDDMILDDVPDSDDLTDELMDKYLGAELMFDVGSGSERRGRVVKRSRGLDGQAIGQAHSNPLFDTHQYVIEFSDGSTDEYLANVIAENMFAQVDNKGNQYQLLKEITDHRKDLSAVSISDGYYVVSKNGNRKPKTTTRGWELLVNWKDGSSDWVKLKDIKDLYPIEIAEYAVASRIAEEPAFNWWVKDVLRKRNRIISKVKSRYWKTTHKFGIQVPKTVDDALRLDEETGTNLWRKAIEKEMSKVSVAWKEHEGTGTPQDARQGRVADMIGFQEIKCHMIFDVKMDFTRKAR